MRHRDYSVKMSIPDILTMKNPYGKCSTGRTFLTAKFLGGGNSLLNFSVRRKFRVAKNPTAKKITAKTPRAHVRPIMVL